MRLCYSTADNLPAILQEFDCGIAIIPYQFYDATGEIG